MEKSADSLTWDEWRKAKEKLYLGEDGKPLPAPMRLMIAYYGRAKGKKTCGDCIHCISKKHPTQASMFVLVCDATNQNDYWQANLPACGHYQARKEELTNK